MKIQGTEASTTLPVTPLSKKKIPTSPPAATGFVSGTIATTVAPEIKAWQQGQPPKVGKNADYGFGFDELTMTKHGTQVVLRYPKANDIPEIKVDLAKPFGEQLDTISAQMVALMKGPAVEQLERKLKANRISSTFDVDVEVNGQTVNLAKAKPDSLTPNFVNAALIEVLKQKIFTHVRADVAAFYGVQTPVGTTVNVTGERALQKLQEVLNRAIELSDKGIGPPLPADPVRRKEYIEALTAFAVRNLFHGENLAIKHLVQGYDVYERNPELNETLAHDIIDRVSIQGVLQLDARAFEPLWARAWVLEEVQRQAPAEYQKLAGQLGPDEAAPSVDPNQLAELCRQHPAWTINPNAGEPRYLLAMYHWGDERSDADAFMHWHRIVNHHDGDLAAGTLLIAQKRENGIEHHAGTEHEGVRHEVSMGYDTEIPFGRTIVKIGTDSAFKGLWSQWALKDIVFQRLLQERGIITPEQLVHSPNRPLYLKMDAAYQALQAVNVSADRALRSLAPKVAFASALREQIDALPNDGKPEPAQLEALLSQVQAAVAGKTPDEAAALIQYFQAKLQQLSVRSADTITATAPLIEKARNAAAASGAANLVTLNASSREQLLSLRSQLDGLKAAAREARDGQDSSLAAVYEVWNDIVTAGFPSRAN